LYYYKPFLKFYTPMLVKVYGSAVFGVDATVVTIDLNIILL